jgi:mono/diheme cytochrome c family protein
MDSKMKKFTMLILVGVLAATGTYIILAAVQPVRGGMMGGGMMEGNALANPGISWVAPPDEALRKNPVPADRNTIAEGRTLFSQNCASCHGTNAKGSSMAPDLTNSSVQNQSDGALFWKITQGKAPMPSFSPIITELQRWEVIDYIRSLSSQRPENTTTTTPPGDSYGMMGPMMSSASMVAGPDGGVFVLMGNELLKYDKDLNLVKKVEIKFDWDNWQKTLSQRRGMTQ